jgi:uncharacterized protein
VVVGMNGGGRQRAVRAARVVRCTGLARGVAWPSDRTGAGRQAMGLMTRKRTAADLGEQPDLEAKRAFLRRPAAHPEAPASVQVIETHFALVFVTDTIVRKLKKPISSAWLDFTTLERRQRAACREVAMNRPLAPGVYRGTETLVIMPTGELAIGGPGRVVDALVKMRRLPAARALDWAAPRLRPGELEAVAGRLAGHYAGAVVAAANPRIADPLMVEPGARLAQIASGLDDLERRLDRGPLRRRSQAMRCLRSFFARGESDLLARVAAGRIVDAHGDLRPEHVYLTATPAIIDRLEFDPALRRSTGSRTWPCSPSISSGRAKPGSGHRLMAGIARRLGDQPPLTLWCFYRGWRALLRAQLAVEHLARPDHRPRVHWLRQAGSYLAIAERHAGRLSTLAAR